MLTLVPQRDNTSADTSITLLAAGRDDHNGCLIPLKYSGEGLAIRKAMIPSSGLPDKVTALQVSHNGDMAAVAISSYEIALYQLPELSLLKHVTKLGLPPRAIAFSPDDSLM